MTHQGRAPLDVQKLNAKSGYFRIGKTSLRNLIDELQGATDVLGLMRMIDGRFEVGDLARKGSDEVDRILPFRVGKRSANARLILQSLTPFQGMDPSERPHVFFLSDSSLGAYQSKLLGLHFGETGLPDGIAIAGNEAIDLNPKTGAALKPKDIKLKVTARDGANFIGIDPKIGLGGGQPGKQVFIHHPLEVRYLVENHVATWDGFLKVMGAFFGADLKDSIDLYLDGAIEVLSFDNGLKPMRLPIPLSSSGGKSSERDIRKTAERSSLSIADAPEMGAFSSSIFLHVFRVQRGTTFSTIVAVEWAVVDADGKLLSPDTYRQAGFHQLGISPTDPSNYLGQSPTRIVGVYMIGQ